MLINIIVELMINLISDITIPASVYDCVSSPTVIAAQFIEKMYLNLYKNIIRHQVSTVFGFSSYLCHSYCLIYYCLNLKIAHVLENIKKKGTSLIKSSASFFILARCVSDTTIRII